MKRRGVHHPSQRHSYRVPLSARAQQRGKLPPVGVFVSASLIGNRRSGGLCLTTGHPAPRQERSLYQPLARTDDGFGRPRCAAWRFDLARIQLGKPRHGPTCLSIPKESAQWPVLAVGRPPGAFSLIAGKSRAAELDASRLGRRKAGLGAVADHDLAPLERDSKRLDDLPGVGPGLS
jgi:hypothetical protein